MSQLLDALCAEHTAYSPRKSTDTLFQMAIGSFDYKGPVDTAIRLIQDTYLVDADLWKEFVALYRTDSDADLGWRGEFWGKMMRGASLTYMYTQDEALYKALEATARDMLTAQQPSGRFSTYSVENEFDSWDLWCRKYILLGFEYFCDICKDEALKAQIITAISRHADYIMKYVGYEKDGKKNITHCTRMWLGLNSSSILEPYMRLYNITGEKKYLDFATCIVDCGGISEGNIWEMAYEDKIAPYQYKTNKAYEMMSCFEGLLEYYRVTGIEKYKTAVIRVAKRILETDITVIGSAGCTHELFDHAANNQLNTEYGGVMQETCVTVTWMKFCFQLLSLTADPTFADAIEISTYNAMLGAVNSQKHKSILRGFPFDSYSPLLFSYRARQSGGFLSLLNGEYYGCCACIGAAGTALMALTSAMLSRDGVYFNGYFPGKITTKTPCDKTAVFTVDTDYPRDGSVKFTVGGDVDEDMTLAFRIPAYCRKVAVSVNGDAQKNVTNGYYRITRHWRGGDVVVLTLDVRAYTYHHEGVDENSKYYVALYKGPVCLAREARLGEEIDSVVDIVTDKDGYVELTPSHTAPFPTEMEYKVPMRDGSFITVVDYQSAGKCWTRDAVMTAWMATKKYWEVDFSKPFYMASRNFDVKRYAALKDGNVLTNATEENPAISFIAEDAGDGYVYLVSNGRYLTAEVTDYTQPVTMADKRDGDCQKWQLRHIVRNDYILLNKKTNCALYEYRTRQTGLLYTLHGSETNSDGRFVYEPINGNLPVNVLMSFKNVK